MKPPIEYRPKPTVSVSESASQKAKEALEAYKAEERAKVAERVRRYRAKKAGK